MHYYMTLLTEVDLSSCLQWPYLNWFYYTVQIHIYILTMSKLNSKVYK